MNYKKKIKLIIKSKITRNIKCLDGRFVRFKRVNLEWWSQKNNVGDCLSPVVCDYMLSLRGLSFDSKAKRTTHLMAVGSICGAGYMNETVWGSGIHHEILKGHVVRRSHENRILDIRAVRGPETEEFLNSQGITCPKVYGDPAIIMPLIYIPKDNTKKYKYSFISHISRKADIKACDDVHMIDIETADYKSFIDEVVRSEKIISSSLHGIILSEAYGIPTVFLCDEMEDQMMKYVDWYRSTGRENFKFAKTIEEALSMEPMNLPELSSMRKKLMDSFPYDLWV